MGQMIKQEQGRSMVEMLGVLAVIGVLSVAGIAGYTTAMRSYRTNEIVNAASMFYVLAKSQNQGNGPIGDIDYATVGGTNPSGATLTYTNNAFTITFTDTDDCTMAANKLGDKATADCANKKITVNFGETTNETPQQEESVTQDVTCSNVGSCTCDPCPAGYKLICSDEFNVAKCTKETGDKLLELCTQMNYGNESFLSEESGYIHCYVP